MIADYMVIDAIISDMVILIDIIITYMYFFDFIYLQLGVIIVANKWLIRFMLRYHSDDFARQ